MKIMRASMLALMPLAGIVIMAPTASNASESFAKWGLLRIMKECTEYTGEAGSFCTVTSSNLAAIPVGSKVLYGQAAGVPANMLDSNVVLDAGNGNRAVGRCTLDLLTGSGLCTFSDGLGRLAGFEARVDVSPPADGINWSWRGTYQFKSWPLH